MIDGNSSSIDTRIRSLAKNGRTPLNVSDIGISPAILLIIKTLSSKDMGLLMKQSLKVIELEIISEEELLKKQSRSLERTP